MSISGFALLSRGSFFRACTLVVMLAGAADAAGACLSKLPGKGAGTSDVRISVLVPASAVGTYQAAGYSVSSCPAAKEELQKIVQHYCGPNRSSSVPARITLMIYGFSREQLCSSARAGFAEAK